MQQLVQNLLLVLLPVLGVSLPGVLKQSHYQEWLNGLIAGLIVLGAAVLTAYTKDQLNANFYQDILYVTIAIASMIAGPLKPLDTYLTTNIKIGNKSAAVIQEQTFVGRGPNTSIVDLNVVTAKRPAVRRATKVDNGG